MSYFKYLGSLVVLLIASTNANAVTHIAQFSIDGPFTVSAQVPFEMEAQSPLTGTIWIDDSYASRINNLASGVVDGSQSFVGLDFVTGNRTWSLEDISGLSQVQFLNGDLIHFGLRFDDSSDSYIQSSGGFIGENSRDSYKFCNNCGSFTSEIEGEPIGIDFAASVAIDVIDATMAATFSPSNGMSLSEAAKSLGYDHFNWVQVITRYDSILLGTDFLPIPLPSLDPPLGGRLGDSADNLPYYWDEVGGYRDGYHIDDHTIADQFLNFSDQPGIIDPLFGLLDPQMHFTTSLVGVRGGSDWVPLYTWEWTSNRVNGEGIVSSRELPNDLPGSGGVLGYTVLDNPWSVSNEIKSIWFENGAIAAVPEPSTWLFMIIGFGLIGAAVRKKKSSIATSGFATILIGARQRSIDS